MIRTIGRYYRTIRHLKGVQIRYQVWYRLRSRWRKFSGHTYPLLLERSAMPLSHAPFISRPISCHGSSFSFLNRSHNFGGEIDWNFSGFGKLWTYNLTYFDYLHQPEMSEGQGVSLIEDFIASMSNVQDGLEPYPISLRGINWIKYLSRHRIQDPEINASLYAQYQILVDNLEYHLMGNHLLENAFSLYIGGLYFRDLSLYEKGRSLLAEQLKEQILEDGGHFERSPMYHAILLERLLDCYNLAQHNSVFDTLKDSSWLERYLRLMISWLQQISFENGDWPMVNDSAFGIAPTNRQLFDYAERLGLSADVHPLSESGYRMLRVNGLECCGDIGAIAPDYIPGHAHSDTLSFVLYDRGQPVIVDPGTSTYEADERRQIERSTASHNTVMVDGAEQSEVWGAFRVGRRAWPLVYEDTDSKITASHTGYQKMRTSHVRTWQVVNSGLKIIDQVSGSYHQAVAYLHLHPDVTPERLSADIFRLGSLELHLEGAETIEIGNYSYCLGFNSRTKARRLIITFRDLLEMDFKKVPI